MAAAATNGAGTRKANNNSIGGHQHKVVPTHNNAENENGDKKMMRRRLNSDCNNTFDAFFLTDGGGLAAKSNLLAGIYSPSKAKPEPSVEATHGLPTTKGQRIVAPPPTLTADMGHHRGDRGLSSARSEVEGNAAAMQFAGHLVASVRPGFVFVR